MTNEEYNEGFGTFKEWNVADDAYLREFAWKKTVQAMSVRLGRPVDRVRWRMVNVLGLECIDERRRGNGYGKVDCRGDVEGKFNVRGVKDLEKFKEYVRQGGMFSGD